MPLGAWTIRAMPGPVGADLTARLPLTPVSGHADVAVVDDVPEGECSHVIVDGPLTEAIDTWDAEVPPQTMAGALWLVPGQANPADAAVAWLILRLQTPTTPLSDLTDANDRALRWSVASAVTVPFPTVEDIAVDPDEVKAWADAQPAVTELGAAVSRIGGDTADAVLTSVQRLRTALEGLADLGASMGPTPTLDAAVAEHLRQVQRTGFARWRGGKARAASLAAVQTAAQEIAGERLREVLAAREQAQIAAARAEHEEQAAADLQRSVLAAAQALALPAEPDFAQVPRSWSSGAPQPRRYIFVHEDHLDAFTQLPVSVRAAQIAPGQAVCALVQSGFSLPAVR